VSACKSSFRVLSPIEFILVLRSVMYHLGSIASQVVQNVDKILYPIACSWWPATAGLLWLRPHLESTAASSSLVSSFSAAVHLVVVAVSSEIADAAAETALTADVNSATVAELFLVMLVLFFIS
jgi:hypothetical protein